MSRSLPTPEAIAITALGYIAAALGGGLITYAYLTYHRQPTHTHSTTPATSPSPLAAAAPIALSPSSISQRVSGDSSDPLDPEWFRVHGHALIDWIVEYRKRLNAEEEEEGDSERWPVQCALQPGWLRVSLPVSAPLLGESWSSVMRDVDALIVPGLTHWQSPHFYAWFKNHASYPSFLGDMLSDAFSSVGFSWLSCPASAELEAIVMDWCAELFHLPEHFFTNSGKGGGSICLTAGEAAIIAILTAKRKMMEGYEAGEVTEEQRQTRETKLTLYVSDQAHGILQRAAKVVGISAVRVKVIKTQKAHRYQLQADDVRKAMEADRAAGFIPFFLWITTGTTSTGAIDDIQSLAAVGHEYSAWVHADAAYGGAYALLPELAHLFDFSPLDSLNINAHKGLFTHFDCAFLWVNDRYFLVNALTLPGMHILRNAASDSGKVIDLKDWGLSFGRRFRSLKLWCMIRVFGVERIRAMLRWSIESLQMVSEWMAEDGRFEVVAEQRLGLLCFRVKDSVADAVHADVTLGNALNKQLMDRCNSEGKIFFSQTQLDGIIILRLSTTGAETQKQIYRDFQVIQANLDKLLDNHTEPQQRKPVNSVTNHNKTTSVKKGRPASKSTSSSSTLSASISKGTSSPSSGRSPRSPHTPTSEIDYSIKAAGNKIIS